MNVLSRLAVQVSLGLGAILLASSALADFSSPVRDVENPARTAFQTNGTINISVGFAGVLNSPIYEVPAGTRAVIEFISARCNSPSGNPIVQVQLGVTELTSGGGSTTRSFQVPVQFQGTDPFSGPLYIGGLVTRLYSDRGLSGGGVTGGVIRANGTGTGACFFTLSGHLISL